jgi:flagellar basal-body rod protein FlgC
MTLTDAFSIASEGISAQAGRMKIHAHNMANINTPYYQRKIPVLLENTDSSFQTTLATLQKGVLEAGASSLPGGVLLAGTVSDKTPGRRLYQPGHPQADKNGFITLSNVDPMIDMADMMQTSRLYEANLAVVSIVKGMANKALEIGRGN